MLQLSIGPWDIDMAKKLTGKMPPKLNGSFLEGKGTFLGKLGEVLVANEYNALLVNDYNYDLLIDDIRVEVKTKACSRFPERNYMCSVNAFNTHQDCDYYCFVRIQNDLRWAWICGFITPLNFKTNSVRYTKGELEGGNGFRVKSDCYSLPILDLKENLVKTIDRETGACHYSRC